jgi:hypothetical protein
MWNRNLMMLAVMGKDKRGALVEEMIRYKQEQVGDDWDFKTVRA